MFTELVAVQPFASVIVIVYVPNANPFTVSVVSPLFHKYVNGGVPPFGVATALPLLTVQPVGFPITVTNGEAETETLTEVTAIQPFVSVTVTK